MSKKTASSELTLLRFCQKLGYANFLEMKNAFREYTQNMVKLLSSQQYFVPDATITDENGKSELLREICKEESEACKKFFSSLDLLAIISAAEAIRRSQAHLHLRARHLPCAGGVFGGKAEAALF